MRGAKLISAVLLAAGLVAATACQAQARPAKTPKTKTVTEPVYLYLVIGTDGAAEIKEMTSKQATSAAADLRKDRQEAGKEWTALKQQWVKAVPDTQFPVPQPKSPRVQRLGRVPADATQHKRMTDRHQRRLQAWNVCLIRDHRGEMSAVALRRDNMYGRTTKLLRGYADAALAWAKANPGKKLSSTAKDDGVPQKPVLSVKKQGLASNGLAQKYVDGLAKRIEEQKKEAPEKAKPDKPRKPAKKPVDGPLDPKPEAGGDDAQE